MKLEQAMRPKGSSLERGLQAFISVLPYNCTIAEVGSFAGESTALFLLKGKKIICIDPWSDYVEEHSPGQYYHMIGMGAIEQQFRSRLLGHIQSGRVIQCKMSSVKASEQYNRIFDVVYLDGNHSLESVLEDIRAWKPKVKYGGILAGHDYDRMPVREGVNRLLGSPDQTFEDNTWMKRL